MVSTVGICWGVPIAVNILGCPQWVYAGVCLSPWIFDGVHSGYMLGCAYRRGYFRGLPLRRVLCGVPHVCAFCGVPHCTVSANLKDETRKKIEVFCCALRQMEKRERDRDGRHRHRKTQSETKQIEEPETEKSFERKICDEGKWCTAIYGQEYESNG